MRIGEREEQEREEEKNGEVSASADSCRRNSVQRTIGEERRSNRRFDPFALKKSCSSTMVAFTASGRWTRPPCVGGSTADTGYVLGPFRLAS